MNFPRKGNSGFPQTDDLTETESWNVAKYFTTFYIALPLKELNELELVARFGSLRIDEDLMYTDDEITKRRTEAIKRYWVVLKQLVNDTKFKIKKENKITVEIILHKLNDMRNLFDGMIELSSPNPNEYGLRLNEPFAEQMIDFLTGVKTNYLYVLDKTGLLFKLSDELDFTKVENEFTQGG